MTIEDTLEERGSQYGESYAEQAVIAQSIKERLRNTPNWEKLAAHQKETFEMFATKASRILYGNHTHTDSHHDIGGYFLLSEKELLKLAEDSCNESE